MNKKNIISYIAASTIVVGAFSGVGIFFWKKSKNNSWIEQKPVFNISQKSDKIDIFPTLVKDDYYDFLEIKESKPEINDKFIAKVINDVVKNIKVTDGNLDLSWEKKEKGFLFTFRWINMHQEEYWKTYTFNIKEDN